MSCPPSPRPESSSMSSLCFHDQERLEHPSPVSPAYPAIAPPSFPCRSGSSIPIDGHFESSLTKKQAYRRNRKKSTKRGRSRVTIDTLPDVALLEIFDSYVREGRIQGWHTLVHVCRKWRNVVFGSPRRLNLLLKCTNRTPVRETIDVWPLLPILVQGDGYKTRGVDNIIAALEHNDRIREVDLESFPSWQTEKVLAAMHQPFPALASLFVDYRGETMPVVPASFLSGSAPRLRFLYLNSIPFPGLPKLLLSATHLVELTLREIPHSGYFPPEAMVTALAVLTSLEQLDIRFESPRSRPDRKSRRPPPLTRTLLPALNHLSFIGVSEYMDDLVAWINAPLLYSLHISFFHQLIFDTPQLNHFISRTPVFEAYDKAYLKFYNRLVRVSTMDGNNSLEILCSQSDWQLSSLAQVCSLGFIPAVERLFILEGGYRYPRPSWQDDIETSQWLEVLRPFTAVKDLHISQEFIPRIAPSLQDVGGMVTEVLPALQTLSLGTLPSGPVQESIGKFVTARQLAGCPITIS